jgi:hypothetical protein
MNLAVGHTTKTQKQKLGPAFKGLTTRSARNGNSMSRFRLVLSEAMPLKFHILKVTDGLLSIPPNFLNGQRHR